VSDNPRIEELRRRVQKDPASIAFAQLAEEYRRAGEHQEAVRVCRTGLAKHPSYLSARVTLGRALIELEQHDEAHTELEYVLRSAPENLAAIRGLAEIHQRRGELDEALKHYQTALGIAQHDPELEETVQELTRQLGGPVPARTEVRASEKPGVPARPGVRGDENPEGRANEKPGVQPRSEVRAYENPEGLASERPQAGPDVPVSHRIVPPPIPAANSRPEELLDRRGAPTAAPPPLETFELPEEASATLLSPELEAAADEFTRALEALDAITIDLPAPTFAADSFDLPVIQVTEDDRVMPAIDWEHAGFDALSLPVPDHAGHSTPADEVVIPEPTVGAAAQSSDAIPSPETDAIADLQNWLDNIVLDRNTPTER
jgi:tetratricopeptide (TPR) repeat protein